MEPKRAKEAEAIRNQPDDRIKCVCPKCGNGVFLVFPEHLERSYCKECDVKLIKK